MVKKNRVFLDSSVLIAALLSSQGGSFYILHNLSDRFHFQINQYVFQEVLRVLDSKFGQLKNLKSDFFLLLAVAKIEIIHDPFRGDLKLVENIINKEDAPILISALKISDYLLTLDKDFLTQVVASFSKIRNVIVCNSKEFLKIIE